MFCKKCGKQISDDSNACQYCGAMLTQRPVNSTYNQANTNYQPQPKQQKKTPWKIIVSIVAIVVVLAIVISVVFCVNIKKNEDKKRLLEVLEASTDKPVVEFIHEDYDGDGTTEAYAVVGESEKKEDYTEYYDADIYFVNQTEAEIIKESVSGHSNGTIEVDDTIYVSLEVYDEDSDKGVSFVYTAEENKPVESDISGKYSDVHQDGGKILATDEDGNEIEIVVAENSKNSDYLEATEEDWKNFNEFLSFTSLNHQNYNSESENAYEQAHAFICGYFGSETYYYFFGDNGMERYGADGYDESAKKHIFETNDPLGKLNKTYTYIRYSADNIDWIIKNVFNLSPDRKYADEKCYYYGDYFYMSAGDGGDAPFIFDTEYEKLDNGKYKVQSWGYSAGDSSEGVKINAIIALSEVDGNRVWGLHSFEAISLYSYYLGELKTTYASVFDSFKRKLKSQNEYSDYFCEYAFVDINEDGQDELVFFDGTCEADKTYYFYSLNNGTVIELGKEEGLHSELYNGKGKLIKTSGSGGIGTAYNLVIKNNRIVKTFLEDFTFPPAPNYGPTLAFYSLER